MEQGLLKIGYFRCVRERGTSYVSYKEFLSWDEHYKSEFKEKVDTGSIRLYCACCRDNTLELSITANMVVRVKNNNQQSLHMESCPKSIHYNHWNSELKNGILNTEDERIVFNIALPSVVKSKSSSSSGSSATGSKESTDHRTGILDMVKTLNMHAWTMQTYSKKKEIREANKAGLPQTWAYKGIDDFIRLIFGVSNSVYAKCRGEILPFSSLCYKKQTFYECEDWSMQWFMYAVIEKVSPFKKERKYQYITVRMLSLLGQKAVIRIPTELYEKIMEGYEKDEEGCHRILAGYICRSSFKNDDGSTSEWMTFLKGIIFFCAENGLYAENPFTAAVANYLCDNRVIFTRPYLPLENYGGEIPTFLIERLNDKNLIIDVVSNKDYERRILYCDNNDEYECILIKQESDIESQLASLGAVLR